MAFKAAAHLLFIRLLETNQTDWLQCYNIRKDKAFSTMKKLLYSNIYALSLSKIKFQLFKYIPQFF